MQGEGQQAGLASHTKHNTGLNWLTLSFSILALKCLWKRRRKYCYDFKDTLMELTFSYPLISQLHAYFSPSI